MRQVTVLIVDSHEAVRQALTTALASHREFAIVGSTGCPEAAADLASTARPDVILMDFRKLQGCQRIVGASPSSRLVVLTSFRQPDDEERCRRLGARLHLLKSIGLNSLVQRLRSLVAAERPSE